MLLGGEWREEERMHVLIKGLRRIDLDQRLSRRAIKDRNPRKRI
jgi:hypothetical protein